MHYLRYRTILGELVQTCVLRRVFADLAMQMHRFLKFWILCTKFGEGNTRGNDVVPSPVVYSDPKVDIHCCSCACPRGAHLYPQIVISVLSAVLEARLCRGRSMKANAAKLIEYASLIKSSRGPTQCLDLSVGIAVNVGTCKRFAFLCFTNTASACHK